VQGRHVGPGRFEPGHDRLGMAEEEGACLGQGDRARSARALDEPLVHGAFERGDLLADRRLGVAELEGGATERPGAGDGFESREMADLDAEPAAADVGMIRVLNGCHENFDWC
jgi:hypothetical protein